MLFSNEYFTKKGQLEAQKHWDINSVLLQQHHDSETTLANKRWKEQQEKDDLEAKLFCEKVKKFLGF